MFGQDLSTCFEAHHKIIRLTRADADIVDPAETCHAICKAQPDVVIHAAAYTAVDECESSPQTAFRINSDGTRNVALVCKQLRIPMVYISTDYVFDGTKAGAYDESEAPNPINVYGRSKLQGERHVQELLGTFWIVRVSWLFGPTGKCFVQSIMQQALQGKDLRVVDDQFGSPTYTMDAAETVEQLIDRAPPGIYNVTNQGHCSWFEFASDILWKARLENAKLIPISSSELDRKAKRPMNSRLSNSHLLAQGFDPLPDWKEGVAKYIQRAGSK